MRMAQIRNHARTEINAVYPKVAETMADALGCDVEDIKPDVSLIEGLDAESIDFLDMVFRLERAFKIKIPRGKIVENARGDLPEAEFEQKGIVTEDGLAQLREYLSEVPAERFKTPMKVADIPRLFTPETFCKLVVAAQRRRKRRRPRAVTDGRSMRPTLRRVLVRRPHHRVRAGATRARGAFAVPRHASTRFRRASWPRPSASSRRGCRWSTSAFAAGPVAALASETRFRARRRSPATRWRSRSTSTSATTTRCAYNGRAQRRRAAT